MTTTASQPTAPALDDVSASPRNRVLAAGMLLGPLLLLTSSLQTDDSAAGAFQIWAMAGLLLALTGVTQTAARRRPRLAAAVTAVGAVGIAGGAAYGLHGVYIGAGAEDLNETSGLAVTFAMHIPGPILALAFIGMGVLMVAARVGPVWSGWALVVAGVVFPVSRIGDIAPLMPVPDVLLLLGLAPLALSLWAGRGVRRDRHGQSAQTA